MGDEDDGGVGAEMGKRSSYKERIVLKMDELGTRMGGEWLGIVDIIKMKVDSVGWISGVNDEETRRTGIDEPSLHGVQLVSLQYDGLVPIFNVVYVIFR